MDGPRPATPQIAAAAARSRRRLLLTVTLLGVAFACASGPPAPPAVHWGSDECSHCHMILSEPRFAAVARHADGGEARFDDLGCMARWRAASPVEGWRVWVRDADGDAWIDATTAWFVQVPGRSTPMGSGLTAHATRAAAEAVVAGATGAELRVWPALDRGGAAHHPPAADPG
jgi:copper chaperone NosL